MTQLPIEPVIRIFTGYWSQTGEDKPSFRVFHNTLIGEILWERISEGIYEGTLTDGFPVGQTFFPIWGIGDENIRYTYAADGGELGCITVEHIDNSTIRIKAYRDASSAGTLEDPNNADKYFPFEIRVYKI